MAASKKTITERQFQVLVRKIRKIHERAENATADSSLETYWTYGDLIAELRLSGQVGYHNSVLKDLSRETGIALRILQHAVAFRGVYSSTPVGQGLSWSHYRVLVRVASDKQRKFYADLARKEGWTSRELQQAIAADLFDGGKQGNPELARPQKGAFLYKVARARVIDGDTVEVLVDLGFHSFTEQRLRLAQIDAADVQTKAGREARNFLVEAQLRSHDRASDREDRLSRPLRRGPLLRESRSHHRRMLREGHAPERPLGERKTRARRRLSADPPASAANLGWGAGCAPARLDMIREGADRAVTHPCALWDQSPPSWRAERSRMSFFVSSLRHARPRS